MKKLLLLVFVIICKESYSQWQILSPGYPNVMVVDITQSGPSKLFAVGTEVNGSVFSPVVFVSQDNGATWDTIKVPPSGYFFQTIGFLNESLGYIGVGGVACMVQTTDSGNTWSYYYQNPSGSAINDIEIIDSLHAVACGYGPLLYSTGAAYTLTNPTTWAPIAQTFPSSSFEDMQMLNLDTGYALSLSSKEIFSTTDGGNSWSSLHSFPDYIEKMFWWNVNAGIAVGFNAHYYKTTDGGNNWSVDSIAGYTTELTGVAFFDSFSGYACGADGKLFYSDDGGTTWNPEPSFTTNDFYNLEIHGSFAYAVGANGTIVRHENPLTIIPVKEKNDVKLFPNPAHESVQVTVEFFIESVSISDVMGRTASFNPDGQQKEYSMNIGELPDGIYFIRIEDGKNLSMQKLIVHH